MIKFEHTEVVGWEHAIRGMRNPMNSWKKSDSGWDLIGTKEDDDRYLSVKYDRDFEYNLGPNDRDLMTRLRNAGTDHRKFMRMITVYVDITAPLYWWKEFDTYKVGTVANSCSTMHKIAAKEFTRDDFSWEHLISSPIPNFIAKSHVTEKSESGTKCYSFGIDVTPNGFLEMIIDVLNVYRELYLKTKNKDYWWQMIQLLPSSYNQKRTVILNYEVLANMYNGRVKAPHKLDEWRIYFAKWVEDLPYSEIITGVEKDFSTHEFLNKEIVQPIEHLVDVTCSWDLEHLNGIRLYVIGPGYSREDLTPYELRLLEISEAYWNYKKEKGE